MIYVVSGFMRSGTSMMCRCLEAGGMTAVKSPDREAMAERHSDQHYKMNPSGLYEPGSRERHLKGWPRQEVGKVLKVVAPLIGYLSVAEYRVVFMCRDPEEIRQSYEAAGFGRATVQQIKETTDEALERLGNRKDVSSLTVLNYCEVIDDPLPAFETLLANGWPISPVDAAVCVDPTQYRFRLERLTAGL